MDLAVLINSSCLARALPFNSASLFSAASTLGMPSAFKFRSNQDLSTNSLSSSGIARPLSQRRADSWVIESDVDVRRLNSLATKAAEGISWYRKAREVIDH